MLTRAQTTLASPPAAADDSTSLTLNIIDERVTVQWPAAVPAAREVVLAWFGWFAAPGAGADYTVTLEVETSRGLAREAAAPPTMPEARVTDGRLHWSWPDGTEAVYDPQRRAATYREVRFCGARFRSFLLIITALRLVERDGMMLHAGALVDDGEALLLVGLSEAGKSTLVRDAQPSDALADDIAVLRREGDQWWAYRSPWRQGGTGCQWPLDGAKRLPVRTSFLLQRQPDNEFCEPLTPPEAIPALVRCLWLPSLPPDQAAAFHASELRLVAALGLASPWYQLSYVRANGTPWRLLRKEEAHVT